MDATAHVLPNGHNNFVAQIAGRLPVFWAGNLATGLAARNIDIVSGRGVATGREWDVSLDLVGRRAATPPDKLNLLELIEIDSAPKITNLKLTRFVCTSLPDGPLQVRVFAPDQPGFLSQLLRSMALISLFLREFEIDTPNGAIQDRFVLSGAGGSVAPAARLAVEKMLGKLTG